MYPVANAGAGSNSTAVLLCCGRAKRTCANVPGLAKSQTYFCEVMHCGKQPLFRITPLDRCACALHIPSALHAAASARTCLYVCVSEHCVGFAAFVLCVPFVCDRMQRGRKAPHSGQQPQSRSSTAKSASEEGVSQSFLVPQSSEHLLVLLCA